MSGQKRYTFTAIETCNMCGSGTGTHRILGKRLDRSQGRDPWKRKGITTTIVKCNVCGLIFADPQPVPFDLADHYGVPPEEYWKENYFAPDETYFQDELKQLGRIMDIRPGMRSLDIGAGLGKAMIALAKAGFEAHGFEPSAPFRDRAIERMGIAPERLLLGQVEDMEYPGNSFDFISFGAVLEHLYDPSDSILRAMRWLRPMGVIHIEVPSSDWLINRLINLYYRMRLSDYVGNISPMHEPYHLYEFALKSFQAHARKHGYEVAFHEYFVCQTFLPRFADSLLRPLMRRTGTGMQLAVWLRKK